MNPHEEKITVECIDEFGNPIKFEFKKDVTTIEITHENLSSIDLSPLRFCQKLETLDLIYNHLRNISLEPLRFCSNLKSLTLTRNMLQNVDLTPLISCASLKILDVSMCELQCINLTPLQSCKKLQVLGLNQNNLREISFTPLGSCKSLGIIDLSKNQIRNINLRSLESNQNLRILDLSSNKLNELDLSPLENCSKLEVLNINNNQLRTIDLSPLASCDKLHRLNLNENYIGEIDITFLVFMNQRVWELEHLQNVLLHTFLSERTFVLYYDHFLPSGIKYDVPPKSMDFQIISKLVPVVRKSEPSWKRLVLTQGILSVLDLDWLGLLDNDIDSILDMMVDSNDFISFRERAIPVILSLIRKQIMKHGTTIGLDIERMSTCKELTTLTERVLELRRQELRQVRVTIQQENVDLTSLWLTAYGHKILTALEFGLKIDLSGLRQIENEILTLGIDINLDGEDRRYHNEVISNDIRNYILWSRNLLT